MSCGHCGTEAETEEAEEAVYYCEKCGATSEEQEVCCDQPMTKSEEPG